MHNEAISMDTKWCCLDFLNSKIIRQYKDWEIVVWVRVEKSWVMETQSSKFSEGWKEDPGSAYVLHRYRWIKVNVARRA